MWQFKQIALDDTAFFPLYFLFPPPFLLVFIPVSVNWVCIMCQILSDTKIFFVPKEVETII